MQIISEQKGKHIFLGEIKHPIFHLSKVSLFIICLVFSWYVCRLKLGLLGLIFTFPYSYKNVIQVIGWNLYNNLNDAFYIRINKEINFLL